MPAAVGNRQDKVAGPRPKQGAPPAKAGDGACGGKPALAAPDSGRGAKRRGGRGGWGSRVVRWGEIGTLGRKCGPSSRPSYAGSRRPCKPPPCPRRRDATDPATPTKPPAKRVRKNEDVIKVRLGGVGGLVGAAAARWRRGRQRRRCRGRRRAALMKKKKKTGHNRQVGAAAPARRAGRREGGPGAGDPGTLARRVCSAGHVAHRVARAAGRRQGGPARRAGCLAGGGHAGPGASGQKLLRPLFGGAPCRDGRPRGCCRRGERWNGVSGC